MFDTDGILTITDPLQEKYGPGFTKPHLNRLVLGYLDYINCSWDDPKLTGRPVEFSAIERGGLALRFVRSQSQKVEKVQEQSIENVVPGYTIASDMLFLYLIQNSDLNQINFKCLPPIVVARGLYKDMGMAFPAAIRLWCRYAYAFAKLVLMNEEHNLGIDINVQIPDDYSALPIKNELLQEISKDSQFFVGVVKDLWSLIVSMRHGTKKKNLSEIKTIVEGYKGAIIFAGQFQNVDYDLPSKTLTRHEILGDKPLIIHYHLFKNAGTSLDQVMHRNFDKGWVEREFDGSIQDRLKQAEDFLNNNPKLKVLSSHSLVGPLPDLDKKTIIPLIFIRHPIVRMLSAYKFERVQDAQTPGALLAKKTDFKGYVHKRLADGRGSLFINYQANRLSQFVKGPRAAIEVRAFKALQDLPFIGRVEDFSTSMHRLEVLLKPYFPSFKAHDVHANRLTDKTTSVTEKLSQIKTMLGNDLYQECVSKNAIDLKIYDYLKKLYS